MTRARLLQSFSLLALFAVAAIVLGTRLLGPHDLYEKDQPKTMAYTADVVLNHRFSLPRDVIYQPATKPPLYNWIDAVFVEITRRWDEWVLKMPSLLGAIATGAIVYAMSVRGAQRPGRLSDLATGDDRATAGNCLPMLIGALASAIWFTFGSDVRHGSVIRLAFLARPDMLQCNFLTGAWAFATIAIDRPTAKKAFLRTGGRLKSAPQTGELTVRPDMPDVATTSYRSSFYPAIAFWLCVTGAALTKGPAAVIPIVFAIVYALLKPDRKHNLLKLWPGVGLPILIACVGGWLLCAFFQNPEHVKTVILGAEVANRIVDKSPEGIAKPHYYEAMWFVTKTLPWGGAAVIALTVAAMNTRFRRLAMPAALYLIIVIACLSLPAGQRMDYLLPAYPPAAVLIAEMAAFFVGATYMSPEQSDGNQRAASMPPLRIAVLVALLGIPLLLAIQLSHRFRTRFHEVTEHYSDNAVAFTNAVRGLVRPAQRGEKILVLVRGKHPLTTLLGAHPGSYLTRDDLRSAHYVIAPLQPDWQPLLVSQPLPIGFETLETRALTPLGLYEFKFGTAPVDQLVELQKQVATWTPDENPYHEAGTVYRD